MLQQVRMAESSLVFLLSNSLLFPRESKLSETIVIFSLRERQTSLSSYLQCMFHSPGTGTSCTGLWACDICSCRTCALAQRQRPLIRPLRSMRSILIAWRRSRAYRRLDCCSRPLVLPDGTLSARSWRLCYWLCLLQWFRQLQRLHFLSPWGWLCRRYCWRFGGVLFVHFLSSCVLTRSLSRTLRLSVSVLASRNRLHCLPMHFVF